MTVISRLGWTQIQPIGYSPPKQNVARLTLDGICPPVLENILQSVHRPCGILIGKGPTKVVFVTETSHYIWFKIRMDSFSVTRKAAVKNISPGVLMFVWEALEERALPMVMAPRLSSTVMDLAINTMPIGLLAMTLARMMDLPLNTWSM